MERSRSDTPSAGIAGKSVVPTMTGSRTPSIPCPGSRSGRFGKPQMRKLPSRVATESASTPEAELADQVFGSAAFARGPRADCSHPRPTGHRTEEPAAPMHRRPFLELADPRARLR